MEEIRQIALAYYVNLPPNQKNEIIKLFRSMDGDGDGSITFTEFMTFFKFKGEEMTAVALRMFIEFDSDGNGTLDFEEVICFFYALATERMVFCHGCGEYLKGAYFTCLQCIQHGRYDLCCTCFRTANFKHHSGADFYDNYTLLSGITSSPAPTTSSPAPTTSSSKGRKSKEVLQLLDKGADVFVTGWNIAQAAGQIAGCSIM